MMRPPIAAWREAVLTRPSRDPVDPLRFLLDFLPFEARVLRRTGVHLHNICYWSDGFAPWIGRHDDKVIVKYDPRDLRQVYVRLGESYLAALDALIAMRREHNLTPDQIRRVEIGLHRNGITLTGDAATKRHPTSIVGGQFSMFFTGAVALAIGNIMFLSLAIGTCASALLRSGRSSLGMTLGALFFGRISVF